MHVLLLGRGHGMHHVRLEGSMHSPHLEALRAWLGQPAPAKSVIIKIR